MLRARRPIVLAGRLTVGPAGAADAPDDRLRITYPAERTLFPADSVAPTVVWTDDTGGGVRWTVAVRDGAGAEVPTASVDAPRSRPSEDDWKRIKERSLERDVEIAVSSGDRVAARVHVRTSKGPVPHPVALRYHRRRSRPADRPAEPARASRGDRWEGPGQRLISGGPLTFEPRRHDDARTFPALRRLERACRRTGDRLRAPAP